MNDSNQYDGVGKLAEAIADLCGLSVKSQGAIAKLIKQAKDALKITSKAKVMPVDTRLAIWRWHYDRLHPAGAPVEIIAQVPDNEPVEIITQPESVTPVEIIAQVDDDEPEVNNLDVIRVAFYVTKDGKRERRVIALDGFYINGLIAATGITRQGVPKWVQTAVDEYRPFDPRYAVTRQVKYLIVRTITEAIEAAKQPPHRAHP